VADLEAVHALMARLDAAMVVVTVAAEGAGGEVDGCLVGFHSQSSIDPPRYVVWLSVENRTYRLASELATTHLAVHLLSASDHDLAERFGATTGDDVDKMAGLPWSPGAGGAPLVEALPERFVGRILERVRIAEGDHVAFVLEPVSAEVRAGAAEPPLRLSQAGDIDAGHSA
jgi:flavin reductase (DIM6/NTAB) family NADH-FMN oxidoreductase RutF